MPTAGPDSSSSPAARLLEPGATAHSGAGRITRVRMRPMTLSERGVTEPTVSIRALLSGARPPLQSETEFRLADYVNEIAGTRAPGLRDLSPRATRAALDSYLSQRG